MLAYDPDPQATHNPATGVVVPANWLDLLNANFAEIGAAWTSYTPTWTASGTAPALGNGTLAGAYKLLGKLLIVRIRWVAGSTTTFGTGSYFFALPGGVSAKSGIEQTLIGKGVDVSTGFNYVLAGFCTGGATKVEAISNGAGSVGQTSPVTWANGDSIHFNGVIEAA